MCEVSGGKSKAIRHSVQLRLENKGTACQIFCEPGAACLTKSADDKRDEDSLYGKHVLEKMSAWFKFQGVSKIAAIVERVEEIIVRA